MEGSGGLVAVPGAAASRVVVAARIAAWAVGLAGLGIVLRRDLSRRGAGIPRRSPADVVADAVLSRFSRFGLARWLARFVVRHKTMTYLTAVVLLVAAFKYSQFLRRWVVRAAPATSSL